MTFVHVVWDLEDDLDGNVEHVLQHGFTMDEVEGKGHLIVASDISARAVVPDADAASFATAAAAADEGCSFSALIRASATVTVEAVLEGGES